MQVIHSEHIYFLVKSYFKKRNIKVVEQQQQDVLAVQYNQFWYKLQYKANMNALLLSSEMEFVVHLKNVKILAQICNLINAQSALGTWEMDMDTGNLCFRAIIKFLPFAYPSDLEELERILDKTFRFALQSIERNKRYLKVFESFPVAMQEGRGMLDMYWVNFVSA